MPKNGEATVIHSDGYAEIYSRSDVSFIDFPISSPRKVVEVPPHGRLIDVDALKKDLYDRIPLAPLLSKRGGMLFTYDEMDVMDIISAQPTIIEAEEGTTK